MNYCAIVRELSLVKASFGVTILQDLFVDKDKQRFDYAIACGPQNN